MTVTLDQAVSVLRAAGEPTRLRILALLRREELAVSEITRVLGQSQPRVSRHLKLLADAGLIERFPDGAWVFYRLIAAQPARALVDQVLNLIDPAAATFKRDGERLETIAAARAEEAAAYFSANAERWDEIRSLYVSESAVEAAILKVAGDGPFERLVDLGSGTGRMLTLLGPLAKSAIGLDLSRQMLNLARMHCAEAGLHGCELRHGDILGTGLSDGSADLVVIHQVLHYLSEPGAAIAEAGRLVAPGGRLIVVDFASHDQEFLRADHRHRRLGFLDAELEAWMSAAGLRKVSAAALPPPSDRGLVVKIWSAARPTAVLREVI